MNAVGAYDDIDMDGIDGTLFHSVPDSVQRRLMRAYPTMRLIYNPVAETYVVVVKQAGYVQPLGDVYLRGWSLGVAWSGRMDGEQLVAFLKAKDKWTDEYLDENAPLGMGPPGETLDERVNRADTNVKAKHAAMRQAQSDVNLGVAVDAHMDRVDAWRKTNTTKSLPDWLQHVREQEAGETKKVYSKPRLWTPGDN